MTFTATSRIRVYNINGLHVDWIEIGNSVTTQGNPITIAKQGDVYKVGDRRFIRVGDVPSSDTPDNPPDIDPPTFPPPTLRKLRIWGDPVMREYGYDVNIVGTTNWQNLKTWNDKTGWGAVTNFLHIPHADVMMLKGIQIPDSIEYPDGTVRRYTQDHKMNWLCGDRGKIYLQAAEWQTAQSIRWGTTAIGGNFVQIDDIEVKLVPHPRDTGRMVRLEMAKLRGFRNSDWNRSLVELVMEGLVHRCYCAYKNNQFGDTPRGVVYSPFWSPLDWDFAGTLQPDALWLPTDWML